MRLVSAGQRGQRGHALEGLAGPLAVHRLEVVEPPDAVEAQFLGELHPAHELVPRHPLLRHIDSESHAPHLVTHDRPRADLRHPWSAEAPATLAEERPRRRRPSRSDAADRLAPNDSFQKSSVAGGFQGPT